MKSDTPTYDAIQAETVEAVTMVEVTAPATLSEGFKFNATYEGVVFAVEVPAGGVTEGQTLLVPFDPTATVTADATYGGWKDGLFDCTEYGFCHPSLLMACCLPLVLLGQVMTRLKLNWRADPAPSEDWHKTFQVMCYISIIYIFATSFMAPTNPADNGGFLYNFITFFYGLLMLVLTMKVRRIVRERDGIPEERCLGFEDVCCAFWCGCCTVAQLARQTADYDAEEAQFFTIDGLPTGPTPVMTV